MSLNKTRLIHCLVLVQPKEVSEHHCKIFDWDIKHQHCLFDYLPDEKRI